jgi:drug/metabolite transporter (DMT)-like permease
LRVYPINITKQDTRKKAFIALALISVIWGTTWLASKAGVRHMPALQMAGLRQLIGGSLYLVYFVFKKQPWPRGKAWLPIVVLSLLNIFLTNGLSTWGVQFIPSGLGAIIAAIVPLWLVIFALIAGKSSINAQSIIGFLVGFAGICIIFYDHLKDFLQPDFRFGITLSMVGTLSWALGSLYTKQQAQAFNPYFSIGLQMVISGIALTAVARVWGTTIPIEEIPTVAWMAIAYLAVFGSLFAFMAYLYALQNLPTEQVSIYSYINPMIAVLLGAWLYKEPLDKYIITGVLVAVLGVYLVNRSFSKKTL